LIGDVYPDENNLRIGGRQQEADYFNGYMDDVRIYDRALSSNEVQQLYLYEAGPRLNLGVSFVMVVNPSFSGLSLGAAYQLQVSADLKTWMNQGSAFTATNTTMIYPQYFPVANWNQLYFRLVSP
jgi:hypothetical protein